LRALCVCLAFASAAGAADLVVDGTDGGDRFLLQVDAATAGQIEVWRGGVLVDTVARRELGSVTLNGRLGDDLVVVDYTNGFFDVPTTVNGGGQSTPSGDGLLVRGQVPAAAVARYETGAADPGRQVGDSLPHQRSDRP
jgi:hypothetical protein